MVSIDQERAGARALPVREVSGYGIGGSSQKDLALPGGVDAQPSRRNSRRPQDYVLGAKEKYRAAVVYEAFILSLDWGGWFKGSCLNVKEA